MVTAHEQNHHISSAAGKDTALLYNIVQCYVYNVRSTIVHLSFRYMYIQYNSYLTVIGVHEMHDRMHPNYCQIMFVGS